MFYDNFVIGYTTNDIDYENFKIRMWCNDEHIVHYEKFPRYIVLATMVDGKRFVFDGLDQSLIRLTDVGVEPTEMDLRKEFAHRLHQWMRHRDVDQKGLAELTGLTQASISKYICQKATPSFYAIRRIARALDISSDDLWYTR